MGAEGLKGYLKDERDWKMHDATELVRMMEPGTMEKVTSAILIDQGRWRYFYAGTQLYPERFVEAVEKINVKPGFVKYNVREGYDHVTGSYRRLCETTLIFTRRI